MSSCCEIVGYRANIEAVFPPRYNPKPVRAEKRLKSRRKRLSQKLPLRHSLKLKPSGIFGLRWQPVSALRPFGIDRIAVRGSEVGRG